MQPTTGDDPAYGAATRVATARVPGALRSSGRFPDKIVCSTAAGSRMGERIAAAWTVRTDIMSRGREVVADHRGCVLTLITRCDVVVPGPSASGTRSPHVASPSSLRRT